MTETSTPHTYLFEVDMTCGGCSAAVTRVLSKMDGLDIQKVEWETKTVQATAATGSPDFQAVLGKIRKAKNVTIGKDNGVQKWPVSEA